MLGSLYDFDPAADCCTYAELEEIDQWALFRLSQLAARVTQAYQAYEFHTVYHSATNFCINDMSAVYLDILKDRLYCSAPAAPARRKAQTAIYWILKGLLQLLAPVLAFTTDEAWQHLPGPKVQSVHLSSFPAFPEEFNNARIAQRWDLLLKVRDRVLKCLEEARNRKEIGNALEASVQLAAPGQLREVLQTYAPALADLFIVSEVRLAVKEHQPEAPLLQLVDAVDVSVARAPGEKCERCWKYCQPAQGNGAAVVCSRCAEALKACDAT
jgi:isoleucyl-tRNA synthetase